MSDTSKRVLERSQTGNMNLPLWEFYLIITHIYKYLISLFKKTTATKERDQLYQRIKGYMVANVRNQITSLKKWYFAFFYKMDVEVLKTSK